jgi:hypothetical protein
MFEDSDRLRIIVSMWDLLTRLPTETLSIPAGGRRGGRLRRSAMKRRRSPRFRPGQDRRGEGSEGVRGGGRRFVARVASGFVNTWANLYCPFAIEREGSSLISRVAALGTSGPQRPTLGQQPHRTAKTIGADDLTAKGSDSVRELLDG